MIDSLMDSLVLDKLPSLPRLREMLAELCYGAEDLDPILHSFKNDHQLSVGVRDILGKEDIQSTTSALSSIAEVCLDQIAAVEYEKLARKFGRPSIGEGPRAGMTCEMAILGMGKFGGQEMSYHSDVDIVFLYEAEGHTAPDAGQRVDVTSNQHFFSELGTRIIKVASHLSAYGRLYEVDARLRPTGKSGALATSLAEFERYFFQGDAQLWERQALCKARVVSGSELLAAEVGDIVTRAAVDHPWQPADAGEIRQMRSRLEQTVGAGNLKRGEGGLVDVEFLVQMLQLRHGRTTPTVRVPNTLAAMAALRDAGLLKPDDFQAFDAGYRFLRTIEGRLRLMNSTARDTLPDDPTELAKLASLLHYSNAESLLNDCLAHTQSIRCRFDRIFDEAESKS